MRPLAACLATLALAACTRASSDAPSTASATPERGGTLRVLATSDLDHYSTTSAYTLVAAMVMRGFTRQLVTYPSDSGFDSQTRIVADLASAVPTRENGGISADYLTWTLHVRRGIKWHTNPVRDVTAHDAVRGIKMMCNPVSPVGAPGYYMNTIRGLKDYCDGFGKVPGNVSDIRRYVATHSIEGANAPDDTTIVFRLLHPTSDFLNLLAIQFATPMPVEYLDMLTDGPEFRAHTISDGPYEIVRYQANRELVLARNPAWSSVTDSVHPAYVDSITITLGVDPHAAMQQVQAGTADYSNSVSSSDLAALIATKDPGLVLFPPRGAFADQFSLAINMASTSAGGALQKPAVRHAIEYAVDKAAIARLIGGSAVAVPLRQVVYTGSQGAEPGFDPYSTPGDRGDSVKARRLLAENGLPSGMTLKFAYPNGTPAAQLLQASLVRAGITLRLIPIPLNVYYGEYITNPEIARKGEWDLALAEWQPDWGGNNARTVIQPRFDGRSIGRGGNNYGLYNSAEVNQLIDRALSAPTVAEANTHWTSAAKRIMEDGAVVPLIEMRLAYYRGARMRNCVFAAVQCDVTSAWLRGASSNGGK